MEIFHMRKFSECILQIQQKFRYKNSQYFLHKKLLSFFIFLFSTKLLTFFYKNISHDFFTKIPRIFFIKNSLLTFFYIKVFHFLLKSFYHYFSILTLYRESFFRGQLHCCAGAFLPRYGRPFCQHNSIFW